MVNLKHFFLGILIFLVPTISFLKPYNIDQLSKYDLNIIFLSQIILFISILLISVLIFFLTKIFFKKINLYLFSIFFLGYYLLFLFIPIYEFIIIYILNIYPDLYFIHTKPALSTLIIIFISWLFLVILIFKYKKFEIFYSNTLIIFCSINIVYSLITYFIFTKDFFNDEINFEVIKQSDINQFIKTKIEKQENNYNVYFVLLDGMMSLKNAEFFDIVDENNTKKQLKNNNINYIENSFSSYNFTHFSLASIMEMNYLNLKTHFEKYGGLYPVMLKQKKEKVPLPELIDRLDGNFYWLGNHDMPCLSIKTQPWKCVNVNYDNDLYILSKSIYANTPLNHFINKISGMYYTVEAGGQYAVATIDPDMYQRQMKYFMKKNFVEMNNDEKKFVFIHQMLPHSPYSVNEDCSERIPVLNKVTQDDKNSWLIEIEGYKAAYRCVLKQINKFTKYINEYEPNSIIIFTSDHGEAKTVDYPEKPYYRASIFNAIKAPESCFDNYPLPRSTINVVRFAINCSYNLDIPYLPIIHYRSTDKKDPRLSGTDGEMKKYVF